MTEEIVLPYPGRSDDGQHKNKNEDEVDVEALRAWVAWKNGTPPREIATTLGVSIPTLYRRLEKAILITSVPPRSLLRAIEHERLEDLGKVVRSAMDGQISNADLARLAAEARQLSAARRHLLGLDEQPTAAEGDDEPELPPALREAMRRAEEEAADREAEIRARDNGA